MLLTSDFRRSRLLLLMAASGTRMEFPVSLAYWKRHNGGIAVRCRYIGVSEQFLNVANVRAVVQHVCGK